MNRKKYNEKLWKIENLRKRRLKKKLRRNKILAARRRHLLSQPEQETGSPMQTN